jgi:hypothetical protein
MRGVIGLPGRDPSRPGAKRDMTVLSPFAGQAAAALASTGRFRVLGRAPLEALAEPATGGDVVLEPRQPADGRSAADTYVAGLTATFVALAVPQGNWEVRWKAAQRSPASSRSAPPTAFRRPPSLFSSPQSSPSPLMTGRIGAASTPTRRRRPTSKHPASATTCRGCAAPRSSQPAAPSPRPM